MATATWKGEGEGEGAQTTTLGKTFKKGESVEITDYATWKKLKGNAQFDVEGEVEPEATPDVNTPPSQQSALGSVPKALEPKPKPEVPTSSIAARKTP